MAPPRMRRLLQKRFVIPTAIGALFLAAPMAHAQYNGRDSGRDRDFFPFFGGGGFMAPAPVIIDSTKAPQSRKLEQPPTSNVVVIGDSMADWLAYGLDETYADQPDVGFERKIRAYSGLIRYDAKADTLDWWQVTKDALVPESPKAIIVMLGLNDRISIRDRPPATPPQKGEPQKGDAQKSDTQKSERQKSEPAQASAQQATQQQPASPLAGEGAAPNVAASGASSSAATSETKLVPGASYEFHTDQWAELYAKRIDAMITALKSKGVPIFWVGLPSIRGQRSTTDMNYLNEIYRTRAEKAGIIYVDVWDGFVDEQGRFALQGADFQGQTRKLRTPDGVHFTKPGAVKLASYVDRELRRVMDRALPVALPGPEDTAPAVKPSTVGVRPDVGPVVPLTASGSDSNDLLGANGRPVQLTSDPVADKVLSRGDAIAAPSGRADDFSWPRPGGDASIAPDLPPQPVALTPIVSGKKGAAIDGKKPSDAKAKPGAPTANLTPPKPVKPPAGGF
ncbi:MAG TPA: GDSL-type esterase/lipase family protein [Xanthobacteraceae bacterium]|jgi:hypothetical protein|nr:GDSL-type esterase/lipase family protein [Xanthobacteraceae bacterium]